jgi:H+/Cl- antiporter ClcA
MASQLPGFPETAGVAVGAGAAVAAVLRLPLSAVVLATLLTAHTGEGVGPLIIVGVVVSYVVTLLLSRRPKSFSMAEREPAPPPAPNPAPEPEPVGVS